MLSKAHRAVFFGGAGVSTESGIPDFRSTDGLYNQQWRYPPETILSHEFFMQRTEEFYDFYRQKMLFPLAGPNPAPEYPTPARRPLNSRLDGSRLAEAGIKPMPSVEDALTRYLDEIRDEINP